MGVSVLGLCLARTPVDLWASRRNRWSGGAVTSGTSGTSAQTPGRVVLHLRMLFLFIVVEQLVGSGAIYVGTKRLLMSSSQFLDTRIIYAPFGPSG